jgi:hypothetical protein
MNKNLISLIFVFSTLISGVASMPLSNQVLAQQFPSLNEGGIGSGLSDTLQNTISESRNTSTTLLNQAAVEKLNDIYSLTNVVGISMVDGVQLNEIAIGDENVSVALNYQPLQNSTENDSLPVTVIVTKLPAANLTQLIAVAIESSKTVEMSSNGSGSIDSILDQTKLNPATLNNAIQILSLIQNLQAGFASTTVSSVDNPQTISVQTQGGLESPSSVGPHKFITVLVVPSLGIGPLPLIS